MTPRARTPRPVARGVEEPAVDPRARTDVWFASRGWEPFPFQREVWDAYLQGESGLIHAATGTGKTYAAWFGPLLEELQQRGARSAEQGVSSTPQSAPRAPHSLKVLWLTPLRALAADTSQALRAPLEALGLPWTLETAPATPPPRSAPASVAGCRTR
jgi:ATP-dependent helicase Lhr and Lhr-like helicase